MSKGFRGVPALVVGVSVALAALQAKVHVQSGTNPYRIVDGMMAGKGPGRLGEPWAKLPSGRRMASPGGIEIDVRMPAHDMRHIEIRHCRSLVPADRNELLTPPARARTTLPAATFREA